MADAAPSVDLWLVRTSDNYVAGPYTQEQIRQLIRERQIGLQDELCQANHYWIFLQEREELARLLGADVLQWLSEETEDVTLTQTEPGLVNPELLEKSLAEGMLDGNGDGATTVISRSSHTIAPPGNPTPVPPNSSREPLIHISPSGAQASKMRRYIWLAIVWTAFIAILLIQFLGH